jgi:hypothetical protein
MDEAEKYYCYWKGSTRAKSNAGREPQVVSRQRYVYVYMYTMPLPHQSLASVVGGIHTGANIFLPVHTFAED